MYCTNNLHIMQHHPFLILCWKCFFFFSFLACEECRHIRTWSSLSIVYRGTSQHLYKFCDCFVGIMQMPAGWGMARLIAQHLVSVTSQKIFLCLIYLDYQNNIRQVNDRTSYIIYCTKLAGSNIWNSPLHTVVVCWYWRSCPHIGGEKPPWFKWRPASFFSQLSAC